MAEETRTLYDLLGVTAEASKPEIDKAYLELKASGRLESSALWELERAYVTLSDPNSKRRYDHELANRAHGSPARNATAKRGQAEPARASIVPGSRARRAIALIVLTLTLATGLWKVTWPFVSWRLYAHSSGTELVLKVNGSPFGRVLAYEAGHRFRPGIAADAYHIQRADQSQQWLTREEVNQIAKARE